MERTEYEDLYGIWVYTVWYANRIQEQVCSPTHPLPPRFSPSLYSAKFLPADPRLISHCSVHLASKMAVLPWVFCCPPSHPLLSHPLSTLSQGIMEPRLSSMLFLVVGLSMAVTPWLAAVGQILASKLDQQDVRSLEPQEAEVRGGAMLW